TPAPATERNADVTPPAEAPSVDASENTPAPPPAAKGEPARRGWRRKLSGSGFAKGLSSLFTKHPKLDDELLDELETVLITADVGDNASMELVENLRGRMHKREFADAGALLDDLRQALVAQLENIEPPLDISGSLPFVLL